MGHSCCSSPDEGGLDTMGFLMALVIALVLMVICTPPPRRYVERSLSSRGNQGLGQKGSTLETSYTTTNDQRQRWRSGLMIVAPMQLCFGNPLDLGPPGAGDDGKCWRWDSLAWIKIRHPID
ncbi:hypothetical protein AAC387_Pa09g1503 [Persea americana]